MTVCTVSHPARPVRFLSLSLAVNNNAECGYDGGDCCDCDCIEVRAIASIGVVGGRGLAHVDRCRWWFTLMMGNLVMAIDLCDRSRDHNLKA